MDDKRKLEIAMAVLRYILRKQGVRIAQDSGRQLVNAAKAMGVSVEELKQFAKPLIQELLDEQLGK